MHDKPFFDTAILVYAISTDDRRADQAEALIRGGGFISVQVLNEFAAVAHRKLKMPWKEIGEALRAVRALCEPAAPLRSVPMSGLSDWPLVTGTTFTML